MVARRVDLLEKENDELKDLLDRATRVRTYAAQSEPQLSIASRIPTHEAVREDMPGVSEWVKDKLRTMSDT